jgi:hypothetical protein
LADPPGPAAAVTIPELLPIAAIAVLSIVQVPPLVASVNAVVNPAQTLVVPVIVGGIGYTVTVVVAVQPVGRK